MLQRTPRNAQDSRSYIRAGNVRDESGRPGHRASQPPEGFALIIIKKEKIKINTIVFA